MTNQDDQDITRPLNETRSGHDDAAERLQSDVYEELDRVARRQLAGQGRRAPIEDATRTTILDPLDARASIRPDVDGYSVVRELNRGGQGVVYEAIQSVTKRRVAVKILLQGDAASPAARKRFDREIEFVARLKHPSIISVFHSGATPAGHPYYVMDFVDGEPFDRHVHDRRLSLEETLELMAVVCDAVQYAHQRGIIHRDLKPSNILIDGDGVPRILDFGLAKLLTSQETTSISLTQEIVGTLPYMSPEQASGGAHEIDTRSDVYSLGVILYELLTGHRPYPGGGSIAETLRHITETPPTPPNRSWTCDVGVTRRTTRRWRAGECPIDTDVETIVSKALAKEPERRYQSAGELARDIRRYLASDPIEARADSIVYVLLKQSRRYIRRAPIAAFVLLGAVLTPGFVVALAYWRQAVRERDVAEAAMRFLNNDVLQALSPEEAGRAVDLKDALDAASRQIDSRFGNAPLAEAAIRQTIGNFYASLGNSGTALTHLERALHLRRANLGRNSIAVTETLMSISRVLERMGRCTAAEVNLAEALRSRQARLGDEHPMTQEVRAELAAFARRRGDLERELLLRAGKAAGKGGISATESLTEVDIDLLRDSLREAKAEHGENHPRVAERSAELAGALARRGEVDEAEPLILAAMRIWSGQLGPEHPKARSAFAELEEVLFEADRLGHAAGHLSARLERAMAQPDNPELLSSAAWDVVKRPGHAPALYAEALRAAEKACSLAPENGAYTNTLGVSLYRNGRFNEALRALRLSDERNGGHPADIAFLAMTLKQLGRTQPATREIQRMQALMNKEPWSSDRQTQRFLNEAQALNDQTGTK